MSWKLLVILKQMNDPDRRAIVEAALDQIREQEPQRTGLYLGGTFYGWDGTVVETSNALTSRRHDRQGEHEHGSATATPQP